MADKMVKNMSKLNLGIIHKGLEREKSIYVEDKREGNGFEIYNADCVQGMSKLKENSIHYSVYSPPFASLYTYSNSERDLGNSSNYEQFFEHYAYVVNQLFRITIPGRLTSFHCMDLPTSKVRHGFIGLKDFR